MYMGMCWNESANQDSRVSKYTSTMPCWFRFVSLLFYVTGRLAGRGRMRVEWRLWRGVGWRTCEGDGWGIGDGKERRSVAMSFLQRTHARSALGRRGVSVTLFSDYPLWSIYLSSYYSKISFRRLNRQLRCNVLIISIRHLENFRPTLNFHKWPPIQL